MTSPSTSSPDLSLPSKIPWTHKVLTTDVLPVNLAEIKFQLCESRLHPYENPKLLTHEDCATGKAIRIAADHIKNSEIPVAFPTETVYGLGADATRDEAVRNIFAMKDRYTDNPLILHVGSLVQARRLMMPNTRSNGDLNNIDSVMRDVNGEAKLANGSFISNGTDDKYDIPKVYMSLIDKFWPGPLTILLPLPTNTHLSSYVYANQNTIGVRIPSHPVALALALVADVPIAAPSANKSGFPSPTTALHVAEDLQKRVEIVLDGGPCSVGVESTVVDGLSDPPAILRPGGVSLEEIRACGGVWANVVVHRDLDSSQASQVDGITSPAPRAPGMKYKHYSPTCGVKLYMPGAAPPTIRDLVQSAYKQENARVGILRTRTWAEGLGKGVEAGITIIDKSLGSKGDEISRNLFSALREMDDLHVTTVHIEGILEDDEGLAVMNRLKKAASVIQSAPFLMSREGEL